MRGLLLLASVASAWGWPLTPTLLRYELSEPSPRFLEPLSFSIDAKEYVVALAEGQGEDWEAPLKKIGFSPEMLLQIEEQLLPRAAALGGSLRHRYLLLLTTLEDAADGLVMDLVRQLAPSTHGARLVLVANGYALCQEELKAIREELKLYGWQELVVVETSEFEGYASAVNRAMATVPVQSIAAVMTTSTLCSSNVFTRYETTQAALRQGTPESFVLAHTPMQLPDSAISSAALREMAPWPLLVFSSEAYVALGPLDTGYSFTGGVAAWLQQASDNKSFTLIAWDPADLHCHPVGTEEGRGKEQEQLRLDKRFSLSHEELRLAVRKDLDLFGVSAIDSQKLFDGGRPGGASQELLPLVSQWEGSEESQELLYDYGSKLKTVAVVCVYDDNMFMAANLREVALVVDRVLVLVSNKPWFGQERSFSSTVAILDELLSDTSSPLHEKLEYQVGSWASEPEQREHGYEYVRASGGKYNRALVLDTDEFWHPVDLRRALILAARIDAVYGIGSMHTYWKSLRTVVTPPENFNILWLVNPQQCRALPPQRAVECFGEGTAVVVPREVAICQHLSYARTTDQVLKKVTSFAHAREVQEDWFQRSWVGWDRNNTLTDLHPTHPPAYAAVTSHPLHRMTPELRRLHFRHRLGPGGCEAKGDALLFTDLQRVMCLLPDRESTGADERELRCSGATTPAEEGKVRILQPANGAILTCADGVATVTLSYHVDGGTEAEDRVFVKTSTGERVEVQAGTGHVEISRLKYGTHVFSVELESSRFGNSSAAVTVDAIASGTVPQWTGTALPWQSVDVDLESLLGTDQIRVAILTNHLEQHSQHSIFLTQCQSLPPEQFEFVWFTARADHSRDRALLRQLKELLVPVHVVPVMEPSEEAADVVEAYRKSLAGFDIALTTNSWDDKTVKALLKLAKAAEVPIVVMELPNIYPQIPAEAFVAPSRYVAGHPSVAGLQIPTRVIYPAASGAVEDCIPAGQPYRGHGAIRVGYLGRLHIERSPGLFLHVASLLKTQLMPDQPFEFVIAGGGPEFMVAGLKALASELGLGTTVRFLGPVQKESVGEFLKGMDLLINTSQCETFGIGILDAFKAGTPVVGFQSCGHQESLRYGASVSDPSPLALAQAAADLLTKGDLLAPSQSDCAALEEEFGLRQLVSGYSEYFASLVSAKGRRGPGPYPPIPAAPAVDVLTVGYSPSVEYAMPVLEVALAAALPTFTVESQLLPADLPDLFVVSPLEGGCKLRWSEECAAAAHKLLDQYDSSLHVMLSGEPWDLSAAAGIDLFVVTSSDTSLLPEGPNSVLLTTAATSFAERAGAMPGDLLVHSSGEDEARSRSRGAAYLYSVCERPARQEFHDLLVAEGVDVEALGACKGASKPRDNSRETRESRFSSDWHDTAVEMYRDFRFAVSFEATNAVDGYHSEKIVNAFLAGAVPIYWGPPSATSAFNPNSFIHCGNFDSLAACARYVKAVDSDPALYKSYAEAPPLTQRQLLEAFKGDWLSRRALSEAGRNRLKRLQ
ncbi:unnamed protein product [Chrysoparadoxa australica]